MEKTHWKKLTNPNYVGAHDLQPGQELTVTIESITNEPVKHFDGKSVKEDNCIIARFKGAKKPMILNKTNCKIIAKNVGSNFTEDWVGKSITIYATNVRVGAEVVEGLRIKNTKS